MTLKEIIEFQKKFDSKHAGNFKWNEMITDENVEMLEFLLVSLFGEAGETANIVKKIARGDFKISDKKETLSEEITDIFIYLIKLVYQLDIDLEAEYFKKMNKNEQRFERYETEEKI